MSSMQVLRHPHSVLIGRRPAAAAAIAAVASVAALLSVAVLWPDAKPAVQVAGTADFERQAHCMENAHLVHDVRWAAACMQLAQQGEGDGIADCELPGAHSGPLYALLDEAEQRCVAESRVATLR